MTKTAVLNIGRNLASDLRDKIAGGIYHTGWCKLIWEEAVTVNQSVAGLVDRFDTLSLAKIVFSKLWIAFYNPIDVQKTMIAVP